MAAPDIKALTKLAETLSATATFLEETGPLEQALSEINGRVAAARAEESNLNAVVSGINAEIKALTSKKADHIVGAQAVIDRANAQAVQIVDDAKASAKATRATASKAAEKIIEDANARASEIDAQTQKAQAELTAITDAIANAAKERTTLQKAIDGLKAKFS